MRKARQKQRTFVKNTPMTDELIFEVLCRKQVISTLMTGLLSFLQSKFKDEPAVKSYSFSYFIMARYKPLIRAPSMIAGGYLSFLG